MRRAGAGTAAPRVYFRVRHGIDSEIRAYPCGRGSEYMSSVCQPCLDGLRAKYRNATTSWKARALFDGLPGRA